MSKNTVQIKSKEEYRDTINKISSESSAVGIDAQLTHAVIIEYLENLNKRIENIEKNFATKRGMKHE